MIGICGRGKDNEERGVMMIVSMAGGCAGVCGVGVVMLQSCGFVLLKVVWRGCGVGLRVAGALCFKSDGDVK